MLKMSAPKSLWRSNKLPEFEPEKEQVIPNIAKPDPVDWSQFKTPGLPEAPRYILIPTTSAAFYNLHKLYKQGTLTSSDVSLRDTHVLIVYGLASPSFNNRGVLSQVSITPLGRAYYEKYFYRNKDVKVAFDIINSVICTGIHIEPVLLSNNKYAIRITAYLYAHAYDKTIDLSTTFTMTCPEISDPKRTARLIAFSAATGCRCKSLYSLFMDKFYDKVIPQIQEKLIEKFPYIGELRQSCENN